MGVRGLSLGRLDKVLLAFGAAILALVALEPAVPALAATRWYLLAVLIPLGLLALARRLLSLARWIARQALWRVRHRMLAVFFFVGVVPVSLAVLGALGGGLLLFGPVTANVFTTQFAGVAERLGSIAQPFLWELRYAPKSRVPELLGRFHSSASELFPDLTVHLELDGTAYSLPSDADEESRGPLAPAQGPLRIRGEETLLVVEVRDEVAAGRARLAVPLSFEAVRQLVPGLVLFPLSPTEEDREGEPPPPSDIWTLPPPKHPFDWPIHWGIVTTAHDWTTGDPVTVAYGLRTRPSALWGTLLAQESDSTRALFLFLGCALLAAFGLALLVSAVIAVSLTRTLTKAVNDLYIGTRHVNRGDFSHRVPVKGHDQISDLSRSFNAMTDSIERSIEDSKRRQQLESELEIAREVQQRLFPSNPPDMDGLEVLGVCKPARSVSGDFFDYVQLHDGLLALSFGDVSGKGISAALVMATLHSAVRSQLAQLSRTGQRSLQDAAIQLVDRTNRQLCEGTTPEKFSTLFFAAYDDASGRLVYSNAGHLPPLLMRNGSVECLQVTGMIVGSFPEAPFEAEAVLLERNDLLVAFTDGITEPENQAGEEFGEPRLRESLRRTRDRPLPEIIATVMDEVVAWTGATALQDDMTMLVLRKR